MCCTACHGVPQVRKPARDLPLGILGALGIVTACYMLMSAALVMMLPIGAMDLDAPFAHAFRYYWALMLSCMSLCFAVCSAVYLAVYSAVC